MMLANGKFCDGHFNDFGDIQNLSVLWVKT